MIMKPKFSCQKNVLEQKKQFISGIENQFLIHFQHILLFSQMNFKADEEIIEVF